MLRARVDRVAEAAGRPPAPSRFRRHQNAARDAVLAAIAAGLSDVGENYLQEAREKYVDLPAVHRHFIGHVQTNKAKASSDSSDVVHRSTGSKRAWRSRKRPARSGVRARTRTSERFPDGALRRCAGRAAHLAEQLRSEGLTVDGVMAIGRSKAMSTRVRDAREAFRRGRGTTLSLGMSADWERAFTSGRR